MTTTPGRSRAALRLPLSAGVLALLGLLLGGCATPLRLRVEVDPRVSPVRGATAGGIYSGRERERVRVEGGRDLREARRATLLLRMNFEGQVLRAVVRRETGDDPLRYELSSEGFRPLTDIQIEVLIPGIGRVSRFYPRPEGSQELDLELLAVVQEP